MSIIEFYEALGRIAEEASFIPLPGIYPDDTDWTLEKKMKLPLAHKLEGLIDKIYDKCLDL